MSKILIAALVAMLGGALPLFAQDQPDKIKDLAQVAPVSQPAMADDQTVAPTANGEEKPTEATSEEMAVSQSGNVSIDFRDADIQNVLRILSYKSGVNIVTGPEVTGLVTIKLKDVPWKRALEVILETYGYGYEHKDNIITVTTIESLKKRREDASILAEQEPLITQTFILNYAKASDVIASLDKIKTARGTVNYDERTNTLIVRDLSRNMDLIANVIVQLDRTTPQVLIEAKVVETTLDNAERLGIDWTTQITVSGAKRPTQFPFTAHSENKYLKTDDFPGAESTDFSLGTLNFQQMQAVLELLRNRTDTNILSNPRIVTLNNKPARIVVGREYPFPNYTYNDQQARYQVSGWEYKDIGVIFDVTPHVNHAGYVTLELRPQVTDILGFVTVENASVPQLSKEEAKTSVMIKDGETLVIAGLIKDQVTDSKKKMPFLGDIPLVGLLFQKSEKTVVKQDLLIFVTPHIINNDDTSAPPAK
jgi:type IV pilus assembly protein PilQ